jgi:hypothetical protein
MRRRQPVADSSSDDDAKEESCFDTEDEASDLDTDPIDTESDVELANPDVASFVYNYHDDYVHPPEYYIQQEKEFDEGEFEVEDYRPNTVLLFNVMKGRWYR